MMPGLLSAGIAYLGTMCTESSVSVVESRPNQNAVLTAVHELGHRSVGLCPHTAWPLAERTFC